MKFNLDELDLDKLESYSPGILLRYCEEEEVIVKKKGCTKKYIISEILRYNGEEVDDKQAGDKQVAEMMARFEKEEDAIGEDGDDEEEEDEEEAEEIQEAEEKEESRPKLTQQFSGSFFDRAEEGMDGEATLVVPEYVETPPQPTPKKSKEGEAVTPECAGCKEKKAELERELQRWKEKAKKWKAKAQKLEIEYSYQPSPATTNGKTKSTSTPTKKKGSNAAANKENIPARGKVN